MRYLATVALAAASLLAVTNAFAADKGGPRAYQAAAPATSASGMKVKCYLEASVGKSVTNVEAIDPYGKINLAADGLQGGAGLGCDMINSRIVLGILGRYDLADVKGALGAGNLDGDAMWSAALRGGVKINDGSLLYGLIGAAGTKFDYAGALEPSHRGTLYGIGFGTDVLSPGLEASIEWNHIEWNAKSDGLTRLDPTTDIVRLGLKLKVNVLN